MKINNKSLFIVYLISFILVWLCYIFWWDKNEFDLEFSKKATTTAIIFNLGTDVIVQELYEGRETHVSNVKYLEYSYFVDGKKYDYGAKYSGNKYSVSDEIQIEYVKSNPKLSKVKGTNYRFNYFIRNLIMVGMFSFFLMLGIMSVLKELKIFYRENDQS